MDLETLVPMLIAFVSKYPITATIIGILGSARLIMKPVMTAIRGIVDQTATQSDNLMLDKVEGNKIYKAAIWILDYCLSIKVPTQPTIPAAPAIELPPSSEGQR